jgi:hypothetical protein
MSMTKSDRSQLQSLVRRRFRALRSEVSLRQAELFAEMETQIAARYADEDTAWATAMNEVHEAVLACNRAVNDAWRRVLGDAHQECEYIRMIGSPDRESYRGRVQLRRAATARLEQQVRDAMIKLEQQEVDLLERLLIGGLESDEARAFLDSIPKVAELVPAARLAELDAGTEWTDG